MAGGDPRVSESGNRHVANSQIHWRLLVVWNFLVLIPCLVGGSIAQAPCIWWTYNPKHDTHELTFPCHQTDPGTLQRESLHRNQRHHRAPSKDMFSQQAFGMLNIAQSMKMHETSNTDLAFQEKNCCKSLTQSQIPFLFEDIGRQSLDVTGVSTGPLLKVQTCHVRIGVIHLGAWSETHFPRLDRLVTRHSSHLMPPASNIRGILCGWSRCFINFIWLSQEW